MDLDFQEGFDLYNSSPEHEEPEWVLLNRKFVSEHPYIHSQKRPIFLLDSWVTCDTPSTPDSFRDPSVSSEFEYKKCFIDKIDLKSLVEDPDSFNIDSLFAECTPNESRKKWERPDEVKLLRFMNSTSKTTLEQWKKIANELGRSVNSVRIKAASLKKVQNYLVSAKKPTLQGMITDVIKRFGDKGGTKEEIIKKIEEVYGNLKQKEWKNSVKQILRTKFVKSPGIFRVKVGSVGVEYKKCISMADYILWVLSKYGEMNRSCLKGKIEEEFSQYLNVTEKGGKQIWEMTFAKKLKSCKFIDWSDSRTVYKVS